MTGRPHRDRLRYDLDEIRAELAKVVQRIPPAEFDWAPRPDMKTCRALLLEIGTMEKICVAWLIHQEELDWKQTWDAVAWSDNEASSCLAALERARAETLRYLSDCTEERLQTPIALPESWHQYFAGPTVEPEELLRWVARHEYYHLGQLISYRWIQGDNPYQRT